MIHWLSYHIPKTGGSSLTDHLRNQLAPRGEFCSVTLEQRENQLVLDQVCNFPKSEIKKIRVFQGHGVSRVIANLLPQEKFSEMVFFREPASRMISHYNFRMSSHSMKPTNGMTFRSFYQSFPQNFMLRFMCVRLGIPVNARALDRLIYELSGMFSFTMDDVDQVVPILSGLFNISPEAPRRNVGGLDFPIKLVADEDLISHIRLQNPLDSILFEAVKELSQTSLSRLKALKVEGI